MSRTVGVRGSFTAGGRMRGVLRGQGGVRHVLGHEAGVRLGTLFPKAQMEFLFGWYIMAPTWTPKVCKIMAQNHYKQPKDHHSTYSWVPGKKKIGHDQKGTIPEPLDLIVLGVPLPICNPRSTLLWRSLKHQVPRASKVLHLGICFKLYRDCKYDLGYIP